MPIPMPKPGAERTNKWTKLPCGHRVHHPKTEPPPACPHCADKARSGRFSLMLAAGAARDLERARGDR